MDRADVAMSDESKLFASKPHAVRGAGVSICRGMTSRERLRRCYFNEELDRPGVYSRAGFPSDDPSYDRLKAYLQTCADLKRGWNGRAFESTAPTEQFTERHSAEFDRQVTVLHAPAGELRSTRLVSRQGQPGLHETFFIKTREDAETYLSLPLPRVDGDVSSFDVADREIGERGIVDVQLGLNPAGFVAELCGSEAFAAMTMTDRDVIHALCERQMNVVRRSVRFLLERKVGPYFSVMGQEYVVPPLHGPRDFQDFNVRYDKPIIDLIHEWGGRVHIHCHGPICQVFRGFLDMGTDVLHPFEPPPMGNLTAKEAKAIACGRLCLEGNIQIHRMYEATAEEVCAETVALITDAFDDRRGLIVCPTASPYIRGAGEACFPQYQAMIDTVLHWR
ncbi:MAG: uroporphyrinogen decarboxylase family protein [Verrucomicrobiia bacterium]